MANHPMCEHLLHWKFENYWEATKMIYEGKPIMDGEYLSIAVRKFCGDKTFLEIYEENKWNLNITVTDGGRHSESKLLNYLTTPNIVIYSAVRASCAIPKIYDSCPLMMKTQNGNIEPYYMSNMQGNFDFIDGSVACDLPLARMSELFNINTFVVSQVNPHVALFINNQISTQSTRLDKLMTKLRIMINNEIHHWISQLNNIGIVPDYV